MSRMIFVSLLMAGGGGAGYFFWNYEIERHYENGKLAYVKIAPRPGAGLPWGSALAELPPARTPRPTIRVATFNLGGLDEHKLNDRRVSDVLLRVIPQFELMALQGIQGQTQGVLVRLIEQINTTTGRQYGYAACPAVQGDGADQYSAIVFDQTAVEVDRGTVHLVADPARQFRHPPLVAAFRVRGISEAEALTCTLINVHTDPERAGIELDLLRDVYRAVRDDGRDEDDVLVLGDFAADENHLGQLGQVGDLAAAVTSTPTTVRGTRRVDNILFDRRATIEFTGRAAVVDVLRECDLTLEAGLEVSEHLPVWAEFSSYEGGHPGRVAGSAAPTVQ